MIKRISSFWLFQCGGWLGYYVTLCIFYITFAARVSSSFFVAGAIELLEIILITALLRVFIIRYGVLQKSLSRQITFILVSALMVSFILTLATTITESLVQLPQMDHREPVLFLSWIVNFIIIFIWNLLYFAYHYVAKSNKERLDKARLESIVKELELKTIKAHINPHFIFNALNSIRFLVDENPLQARYAITELSKLLRSSMQAGNIATTSLENEIEIVEAYLGLEKIRFEERLAVTWAVEEEAYEVQLPPMMLQTLVENGIKHGIGKEVAGGTIAITASIQNAQLVLQVENTGRLSSAATNKKGFGIDSTINRLQLMYKAEASFSIGETNHNTVLVEIKIPIVKNSFIE